MQRYSSTVPTICTSTFSVGASWLQLCLAYSISIIKTGTLHSVFLSQMQFWSALFRFYFCLGNCCIKSIQIRYKKKFKWQCLNKQHRFGEKRTKQPLDQAKPIFNDCKFQWHRSGTKHGIKNRKYSQFKLNDSKTFYKPHISRRV